jgi:hypothetical protein
VDKANERREKGGRDGGSGKGDVTVSVGARHF